MTTEIEIIPFKTEHLDRAVELSRQNGWPHRIEDWAMMLDVSQGVVASHNDRIVGTALTTLFGQDHATCNMIIVDKSMQGRGVGLQLMNEVLAIAHGRENRLVATEIGLPLYSKLGFQVTGNISQHQGVLENPPDTDDRCTWDNASNIDALCALDREACAMDRSGLMRALVHVGQVAVVRDSGVVTGFAIMRDFGRGKVIGPVVCKDVETAKSLLRFAFASQPGEFMRVDLPEGTGLYDWINDLGLEHVGEHVRMTLNQRPAQSDSNVQTFALVSQALG